jgi:hypothetical protein
MPYTAAELETFVKELGLPEDKAKAVLGAIGSDGATLEKFGAHVLRQADYSAKLNELATEKTRLEADFQKKREEEDRFHAGVASWKTAKEKEVADRMAQATADAEAKLNAARDKVKSLVARGAVLEDDVKDLLTAPTATTTTRTDDQPRDANGKYLSREEFQNEASFFLRIPGLVTSMEREYFRMFGNDAPAPNWELVMESAKKIKSAQPMRDAFEQTYKLPEKRAEIAKKQHDDDIAAAEKRGAEAARSKMLAENPEISGRTVSRERPGSPILDRGRAQMEEMKKAGKAPASDHASRDTVSAAVAAFNDGKYRQDNKTAA